MSEDVGAGRVIMAGAGALLASWALALSIPSFLTLTHEPDEPDLLITIATFLPLLAFEGARRVLRRQYLIAAALFLLSVGSATYFAFVPNLGFLCLSMICFIAGIGDRLVRGQP